MTRIGVSIVLGTAITIGSAIMLCVVVVKLHELILDRELHGSWQGLLFLLTTAIVIAVFVYGKILDRRVLGVRFFCLPNEMWNRWGAISSPKYTEVDRNAFRRSVNATCYAILFSLIGTIPAFLIVRNQAGFVFDSVGLELAVVCIVFALPLSWVQFSRKLGYGRYWLSTSFPFRFFALTFVTFGFLHYLGDAFQTDIESTWDAFIASFAPFVFCMFLAAILGDLLGYAIHGLPNIRPETKVDPSCDGSPNI